MQKHYLFEGIPASIEVGRYHSWIIAEAGFPDSLEVTARTEDGQVMAVSHKQFDLCGLQFHPESVMTPEGSKILKNWVLH